MEGMSRCHNVRLVGVLEKEEGPSIELFEEEWLEQPVLQGSFTESSCEKWVQAPGEACPGRRRGGVKTPPVSRSTHPVNLKEIS
ncbi:hypothetical protein NDU88_001403 [Pleurodeles waltl]|uniref:KRAB domain-containing protein n=1 Tax=Pleurodeles waltl TaxID=8319 RepID=A0AAV7Q707_PLEWA|nr:hypothetical protein NDU88_001403 [Pleurodeles waltl]